LKGFFYARYNRDLTPPPGVPFLLIWCKFPGGRRLAPVLDFYQHIAPTIADSGIRASLPYRVEQQHAGTSLAQGGYNLFLVVIDLCRAHHITVIASPRT
jgi:hypothetical protein